MLHARNYNARSSRILQKPSDIALAICVLTFWKMKMIKIPTFHSTKSETCIIASLTKAYITLLLNQNPLNLGVPAAGQRPLTGAGS